MKWQKVLKETSNVLCEVKSHRSCPAYKLRCSLHSDDNFLGKSICRLHVSVCIHIYKIEWWEFCVAKTYTLINRTYASEMSTSVVWRRDSVGSNVFKFEYSAWQMTRIVCVAFVICVNTTFFVVFYGFHPKANLKQRKLTSDTFARFRVEKSALVNFILCCTN